MRRQLLQAVTPRIPLLRRIQEWPAISLALGDGPRPGRIPQRAHLRKVLRGDR
jgi:hypothetical protein